MVGLRENHRLLDRIKDWKLRPEGMGKKYMGVEAFSGHMSIYPVWFNTDLEVRVRIRANNRNADGTNLLYVIDFKQDRVVYNGADIDDIEAIPEQTLEMFESMVKMSDNVIDAMRKRETELYEFREIQRELAQRMNDEGHKRLAERYTHHVKEAELLGYPIKTYHEFINTMSDEDKDYIQGVWERSIIPD